MQERTFLKFYGLLGERFCRISAAFQDGFDDLFAIQVRNFAISMLNLIWFERVVLQYGSIHRFETNKLRNVAKFFAHLLYSDGLDWGVLEYIKLTETDTTSSSRIFLKILFQVRTIEYVCIA